MKGTATAIDFGTSKVVVLTGQRKASGDFDVCGSYQIPYAGFRSGNWVEPEKLGKVISTALRSLESKHKKKIKEVYIGIPGDFLKVTYGRGVAAIDRRDKRINADDIDSSMQAAEERLSLTHYEVVHRYPVCFRIDGGTEVLQAIGKRGTQLEVEASFILADRMFIEYMDKLFDRMNITIKEYIPSPLSECLYFISPEERDKRAALIDMGYLSTDISVVEGDGLIFHKSIPLGGGHIASDLAIGLELPLEQAEQLKRQYVFGLDTESIDENSQFDMLIKEGEQTKRISLRDVQGIVEARTEEIAAMVREVLDQSGLLSGTRAGIFLTGGGLAMMRGGKEFVHPILGLPIKVITPNAAGLNHPGYVSAFGSLRYALDDPELTSNAMFISVLKNLKDKFFDFF